MKRIKKMCCFILAMAVLFTGITFPDVQANAAGINYIPLHTNDAWVSGTIKTKGETHYYTVTTNQSGWLSVTYQVFSIEQSLVTIKNYDMTREYAYRDAYNPSPTSPITKSITLGLDPGTYTIVIEGNNIVHLGGYTGDYRIKASFQPANNNERPNNHDFVTAQPLEYGNPVNGFLSWDADVDFYQFSLTTKQKMHLIYTSYIKTSDITIYNKDYISVFNDTMHSGSENSPETCDYKLIFEPGTYYIKVKSASYTGRYTINLLNLVMAQSISISGKSQVTAGKKVQLYASVAPANVSNGSVRWTSGDSYIASVDEETGLVTTYRPGVVNITATTLDGSNISKVYRIIVKPKKMSAPKLKAGKSRQIKVSYSRQTGVKGYQVQYATNSKFKSAKSKKTSSSNITLKSLKRKKTYYVRVRSYIKQGSKTYYGDWSKSKKIKVK